MTFEQLLPHLQQKGFSSFIKEMKDNGTLEKELPEVFALASTPERLDYHPEGDTFSHTMLALEASDAMDAIFDENTKASVNWCLLCHDLGKALTPKDILPQHIGHEIRGLNVIDSVCDRLQTPDKFRKQAIMACKNHMKFHHLTKMKPAKIYNMLKDVTDGFKDFSQFGILTDVCFADFKGRALEDERSIRNAQLCFSVGCFSLGAIDPLVKFHYEDGHGDIILEKIDGSVDQKVIQKISKPIIEYRQTLLKNA